MEGTNSRKEREENLRCSGLEEIEQLRVLGLGPRVGQTAGTSILAEVLGIPHPHSRHGCALLRDVELHIWKTVV